MLANALTRQRKTTTRRRNARRSSVFGNALGNAAVGGIQGMQAGAKERNDWGMTRAEQQALHAMPDAEQQAFFDARANTDAGAQPAMGGVDSDQAVTSAVMSFPGGNGDVPRSTAIAPTATPYVVGASVNGATNLDPIVVTGDANRDNWFMSMWDWSQHYHVSGPPTRGGREALVQYWSQQTQRLAPNYNAYIRNAYSGQTVSSGVGRSYLTDSEFNAFQRQDTLNMLKLASVGPGLGVAAAGAALSPAIAAGMAVYGAYESGNDIADGHYIRGGLTLAASLVGGGFVANELRGMSTFGEMLGTTERAGVASGRIWNAIPNDAVFVSTAPAEEFNAAMIAAGRSPAWMPETQVVTEIAAPGTRYSMAVSEGQAQAIARGIPAFGNFATPDQVLSQAFARNDLAILVPEFKNDVSYAIDLEVTQDLLLNRGIVGRQGTFAGGAQQVEFLPPQAQLQYYLRPVGAPRPLPPH